MSAFEFNGNEKEGLVAVSMIDNRRGGEIVSMDTNGAFVYVGVEPNTEFLKNSHTLYNGDNLLDEDGYVKVNNQDLETMSSVNGLFAIGDVKSGSIRQIATAVGDGAIANGSIIEYLNSYF